jgi:ABC-type transport system substrate-binding protein
MKFLKSIFLKLKKNIFQIKSYPFKKTALSLKFLPRVFNKFEKIILLGLSILILAFIGIIGVNRWISSTQAIPENGGVFREGIVGESKDLDKHLARLLNASLTKYDLQKNIVGDMAEKWDINDGGKSYVFHLKPQFNSEDLANQITSSNQWPDIEISTPDPATIQFNFKQPFSPFLYTSTEPIFPYGPYRITKENKNDIELSARDDYYANRPYIDKIIIKLYPDQDSLLKAAKRGEIDGFALTADTPTISGFRKLEIKLPRQLVVFFNLSNKNLQDINVRKALKENSNPGKALELRLVTSDNQKNVEIAKGIADKWSKNGIKVNLDIKDNVTLQKTTIPKRDYDVLLYGLDYGEDPDPYPFWHSSQIKEDGKNLSNFKNTKGDKLLEEARQEFDFKKREDDYNQFQQILDQEIPAFEVSQDILYYQISKNVKGIEKIVGSFESDRFLNVSTWYLNTKRVKK